MEPTVCSKIKFLLCLITGFYSRTVKVWWTKLNKKKNSNRAFVTAEHGNMTNSCTTLFLASCCRLQMQQCIWSTKCSLLSLIFMQAWSFLLAEMLPELVGTSGGLQMEETESSSRAGLACRPRKEWTL